MNQELCTTIDVIRRSSLSGVLAYLRVLSWNGQSSLFVANLFKVVLQARRKLRTHPTSTSLSSERVPLTRVSSFCQGDARHDGVQEHARKHGKDIDALKWCFFRDTSHKLPFAISIYYDETCVVQAPCKVAAVCIFQAWAATGNFGNMHKSAPTRVLRNEM